MAENKVRIDPEAILAGVQQEQYEKNVDMRRKLAGLLAWPEAIGTMGVNAFFDAVSNAQVFGSDTGLYGRQFIDQDAYDQVTGLIEQKRAGWPTLEMSGATQREMAPVAEAVMPVAQELQQGYDLYEATHPGFSKVVNSPFVKSAARAMEWLPAPAAYLKHGMNQVKKSPETIRDVLESIAWTKNVPGGQVAISAPEVPGGAALPAGAVSGIFNSHDEYVEWMKLSPEERWRARYGEGPFNNPKKYYPDGTLKTDDPARKQPPDRPQAVPADRDAAWASQQASADRNRGKRLKDGRYVGGPEHITTPEARQDLVDQYADRIERAIDNGFAPGYFYADGRETIKAISEPGMEVKNAQLTGVTSSQVGPKDNMNYFARGAEQRAMIGPHGVSTTLYPNQSQSEFLNTIGMGKETPWLGHKRERYSNLLIPEDSLPENMPPASMGAPNDRWEARAAGLDNPPTTEPQVAWVDGIREEAMGKVNARRAENGLRPLSVEEAQELHWAQIRADSEGRPPILRPEDTISGSVNRLMYSHSWETMPGKTSGHAPEVGVTISPIEYHNSMYPLIIGEDGKDILIRTMGSDYQLPAYKAPGEFEGQFSPGIQSRSMISQTDKHGLLPQSQARVSGTEAVRSYLLAQDADAGNVFAPVAVNKPWNGVSYDMGGTTSKEVLKAVKKSISAEFGKQAGDIVVVPSESGVRVFMPFGANAKFRNKMKVVNERVREITGANSTYGLTRSHYNELGWKNGTATKDMLSILDDPAAPLLLKHANSKQMRRLVGSFADKYDQIKAAGITVNDKLVAALKTWRDQGLEGLRDMVKAGTAPAALLAILAGQDEAST